MLYLLMFYLVKNFAVQHEDVRIPKLLINYATI